MAGRPRPRRSRWALERPAKDRVVVVVCQCVCENGIFELGSYQGANSDFWRVSFTRLFAYKKMQSVV